MSKLVLDEIRRQGHILNSNPDSLNIIGIRNTGGRVNYFDDWIGCGFKTLDGEWILDLFKGSTRPGINYLLKPVNRKGAAILVKGQYQDAYELGMYKNYSALRQVRPVKVYRDSNTNSAFDMDSSTIEEGLFGIHIHKAGFWSRLVGPFSAGCQVFQRKADFDLFIDRCLSFWRRGQKRFTYTLIEI